MHLGVGWGRNGRQGWHTGELRKWASPFSNQLSSSDSAQLLEDHADASDTLKDSRVNSLH